MIQDEDNFYGEKKLALLMAKEFLENRLGIDATKENIRRLAVHLIEFEKEVKRHSIKNGRDHVLND